MIEYNNIAILRESVIRQLGELDKSSYFQKDNRFAIFNDVSNLSLPLEPRRVDINAFIICQEGTCEYSIDTRQMEMVKNSHLIIFPGQTVHVHRISEDFKCLVVCLSKEQAQQIINQMQDVVPLFVYIRQHPLAYLTSEQVEWGRNFANLMLQQLRSKDNLYRQQALISMLKTLYYTATSIYGTLLASTPLRNSRQEDIFVQFVQLLEDNYQEHRDVNFYAEKMSVTPKYLSTVIKSVSGRAASACIDSYVIEEAKSIMRTTRYSILEVSQKLNFPNQSFFGKYFKRLTGMSPFQYRKMYR